MSMKKATPKAVFAACEQLELLDKAWNRDDVRILVGGGSFSVIDPLIQAWRKLQPVREVAPSVPSDLLLQVATMLEQQVSSYIEGVKQRDQEREKALLEMNQAIADNLQEMEVDLTDKLEQGQQANHELEAELSRLENELKEKSQSLQLTQLKLEVAEDAVESLNGRMREQAVLHEAALGKQKDAGQDEVIRINEVHQQQLSDLKLEHQQQVALQKRELIDAAQAAENRLMRLLDQSRSELRVLNVESARQLETLKSELQAEKQRSHEHKLELKLLNSKYDALVLDSEKAIQSAKEQVEEFKHQLMQFQEQGSQQEKNDLQQLKDSIRLLQKQVQER